MQSYPCMAALRTMSAYKVHPILSEVRMRLVQMSDYTVGGDCFQTIPVVLGRYHARKAALVGSAPSLAAAAPQIEEVIDAFPIESLGTIDYGTHCTQGAIDALLKNSAFSAAEVAIAIGGGADIDTVKATALYADHKMVFSVPTACSTCSAATGLSVVYHDDGSIKECLRVDSPVRIFINQHVIAQAPWQLFWAGIGDALSKQVEIEFACSGGITKHTAKLGLAIARSCAEPLFEYGLQALADVREGRATKAVQQIALDIIVNTGNVSNLMNQNDFYFNSSLAHAFFNASTGIGREGRSMHGEVVSFGVLVLLAYQDKNSEMERYARFNKSIGLPVTLADMDLTKEHLSRLRELVQTTGEWQNPSPAPCDIDRYMEAISAADAFGHTL